MLACPCDIFHLYFASAPHHTVNNLFPEQQCFMESGNHRIENFLKCRNSTCVLPTGKAALPPPSFASTTSCPGIHAPGSNPKPAFQPSVHQCSASYSNHVPSRAYYYYCIKCIFYSPFISDIQSKKRQADICFSS